MKLLSWFKWEPHGYWVMQSAAAAAASWTLYCAIFSDEGRAHIVLDAVLAGVNTAAVFHNWLHRIRDQRQLRMIKIMDQQQELLREICATKSHEIAQMIADRINGETVSIQGPDGPITPSPTKH